MTSGFSNFNPTQHANLNSQRKTFIQDAQDMTKAANATPMIPANVKPETVHGEGEMGKMSIYEWIDAEGRHQYIKGVKGFSSHSVFDENGKLLKEMSIAVDHKGELESYTYDVFDDDGAYKSVHYDYNTEDLSYTERGNDYRYTIEDKNGDGALTVEDMVKFEMLDENRKKTQEVRFYYSDANGNGIEDDDLLTYIDMFDEEERRISEEISRNGRFDHSMTYKYYENGNVKETFETDCDTTTKRTKYNEENTQRLIEIDNIKAPFANPLYNFLGEVGSDGRVDETKKEAKNPGGIWEETNLSFWEWLFKKG